MPNTYKLIECHDVNGNPSNWRVLLDSEDNPITLPNGYMMSFFLEPRGVNQYQLAQRIMQVIAIHEDSR